MQLMGVALPCGFVVVTFSKLFMALGLLVLFCCDVLRVANDTLGVVEVLDHKSDHQQTRGYE